MVKSIMIFPLKILRRYTGRLRNIETDGKGSGDMETKFDVISLGQLCADIVLRPVNRLPAVGTADMLEQIELKCGGCALNTGLVLRKLGVATALAGKVGGDTFGKFLLEHIKDLGADTHMIKTDARINTTTAIVLISENGERSFLCCQGGNERFSLEDIEMGSLSMSKILHIGGIMKLKSLNTAGLLKHAQYSGVTTSIDTDWDTTGQWLVRIKDCLEYTDIFFTSIEEGRLISSCKTRQEIGRFFLDRGVKTFVLKMGEQGSYIKSARDEFTVPAFDVAVMDTTGAGDAFVAGFLAGYSKYWEPLKILKFANACGALCTTRIGTTEGIEDLSSTLRFTEKALLKTKGFSL
jgi:sugar/nucleoside kinase (ribokinase family)